MCQVSCPNMAILKTSPYLGNRCRKAKISSISTPWGRKRAYMQLLELWRLAKFHVQIWQFWKLARITAARRPKISSISTPWGRFEFEIRTSISRKRVYVQFLELWPIANFHAQVWQFRKSACISETAARRAKISSISTSWGKKGVCVQFLELLPMAKFHAQIRAILNSPYLSNRCP